MSWPLRHARFVPLGLECRCHGIMARYETALQEAKARIASAARLAGRSPDEVTLLAVSKTFPSAAIREAHEDGQRAFGENYVQEALVKRDSLLELSDIRWVLIGPLQSNKTTLAAQAFDRVESVDRLKIAQRLSAARDAAQRPLEVLVQVNISGESTKSGVAPAEAVSLAEAVAALPQLAFRGFMGIAEPVDDVTAQRKQFALLRHCRDGARARGLDASVLSMGMSADLESAVAEGSTQVRLGTAIFGSRP